MFPCFLRCLSLHAPTLLYRCLTPMQTAQAGLPFGFDAQLRFATHNQSLRRCSENAAQISERRQQLLRRKQRRPKHVGKAQYDLLSQPKKMDSGRLKAKQAREESEMREKYHEKSDFCFRPESLDNLPPFVTKFHCIDNLDLRNLVAKDQNKERHVENAPELIDSVAQTESRPPFITAVGSLTSKMPSKFQLEIEGARATAVMHKGPPVSAHRFRDEAPGHFHLYFQRATDKHKDIARQARENKQRKVPPKVAWGNNQEAHPQSRTRNTSSQRNTRKSSALDGIASCYSIEEYHIRKN